jgi:hypothetical protein
MLHRFGDGKHRGAGLSNQLRTYLDCHTVVVMRQGLAEVAVAGPVYKRDM